ncbi:FAD-binding oxidoreductase [Nocardioides bizhenqiangii]|uniref:FAD-binding oxidoreductase n=1 Tax=Nocardioides bizhenqiangii TaxID=3095076 RepID=A0ABZ0ZNW7_9ACTN|nr:FAD-binding oxidoreductase [Nocardioides sp. HM61]WQQ25322.1 FAD-binding oxidoreductase [Nocardioides sp. HM61]
MGTSSARERLARQVTGRVYDGATADAVAEAAGFNTAVTHRPAVVVAASTAQDVAAAVAFANDEGLPVAVQATGHGAVAPSVGSVLVSTRHLQGLTIDPAARRARVGAGVRWRSVIDAAVPHGLAPLSGSSSGVGVVGYTLGGGMGHLARRHGFAADHVRAVELVTADGQIRTVTAETDPELFWAVRGGQSRFGIATALEFDLFPVPEFFGGALIFTGPAVAEVLHAWSTWASTMPEEVTTSVALLRLPPIDDVPPPLRGVVSLALRFGFTGSADRGEALLAPMRRAATPALDSVGPMSFAAVDGIHMDPPEPLPAVARGGLLGSMEPGLIDSLLAVAGTGVDVPLAAVELRLMGGALDRPAAIPNAVAGRDGAYSLSVIAPAPPPLTAVAPVVTAQVVDPLKPWATSSSLVNFAGHGSGPESAWTPDALARLRRVKATVDPRNLFGGGLAADAVSAGAR